MERMTKGAAATMRPMTLEQFRDFYAIEYPKLIKILVLALDATIDEAEAAAQEAMTDLAQRVKKGQSPDRNPVGYVRTAAVRCFVRGRQRDRQRRERELKGYRLVPEEQLDQQLTTWEDDQYIGHLLECLTVTQRDVIKRVMDGMSTREIAEELGKTEVTIRQHLKNSRDTLKRHPEIAPLAPKRSPGLGPAQEVRSTAATPTPRKEEVQ